MPMDFPTMKSLELAAEVWDFRKPKNGEPEARYREALANHVEPKDIIESQEIRTKHGWDQFSQVENEDLAVRAGRRWRK